MSPFRYFGWYSDTGHTELITRQMANDLRHWHSVRRKPIVITEYGADTVAGMHQVNNQSHAVTVKKGVLSKKLKYLGK